MLEGNMFRIATLGIALVVFAAVVTYFASNLPTFYEISDSFFGNRLQKF